MPESSPSVLIIRLDGIGDALALTPLLAALRAHAIPADVVLRPENAGIFSSRAARAMVTASFALRSSDARDQAAIAQLGRELAVKKYSHVLVATEDPSGYRLAHATGAPVRIGFSNAWGKPLKSVWLRAMLTRTVYRSAGLDRRAPHECDVLFSLGRSLLPGAKPSRQVSELAPLVLESPARPDDRVVVQLTDKWARLGIERERVLELLELLSKDHDVALIGTARERVYAQDLATASNRHVELFENLEPWKMAIAQSRALVAPDSGAVHVAGMTGTPVVAVFPPGPDVALQTARWAPWAAPYEIVIAGNGWPVRAEQALTALLQRSVESG